MKTEPKKSLNTCLFSVFYLLITTILLQSCVDPEGTVRPDGTIVTENLVDLRAQQTPIRDQGGRNTCITFAAVAALEASYKREGYGDMDLSEEFVNYFGKMFWLHPNWNDIVAKGEDGSESQVGAYGGGGGVGYLKQISKGFHIPEETAMPYRSSNYGTSDYPMLANAWDAEYWNKQRRMNDFNLDARNITKSLLRSPQFFGIERMVQINNPRSTREIEAALKLGREVVFDFFAPGWQMDRDKIWRKCASCTNATAHSMLIVGFDRTDPDPNKHYFIVKNSWGRAASTADSQGFTHIGYDFIDFATEAGYILSINEPTAWPELAFIGRWKLNFDGWNGVLDIYHLPGMSQWLFDERGLGITDRRLGTFYDQDGKAHRVNGKVEGNRIEFYFDGAEPNLRWDKLQGRRFVYYLSKNPINEWMAGIHYDGPGTASAYAGFATKSLIFNMGIRTPRPFNKDSFKSSNWAFTVVGLPYYISVPNSEPTENSTEWVYEATLHSNTTTSSAIFAVLKSDPRKVRVQCRIDGKLLRLNGIHLTWEDGSIAGSFEGLEEDHIEPFYMYRFNP